MYKTSDSSGLRRSHIACRVKNLKLRAVVGRGIAVTYIVIYDLIYILYNYIYIYLSKLKSHALCPRWSMCTIWEGAMVRCSMVRGAIE